MTSPERERLPDERRSDTHKFSVAGHEGYIHLGYYPDGRLGEIFVRIAKEGSTTSGLLDAWATMVSVALQYRVPLEVVCQKFRGWRFEPNGLTENPLIERAASLIDYIIRYIELKTGVAAATPGTCTSCGSVMNDGDCIQCKENA